MQEGNQVSISDAPVNKLITSSVSLNRIRVMWLVRDKNGQAWIFLHKPKKLKRKGIWYVPDKKNKPYFWKLPYPLDLISDNVCWEDYAPKKVYLAYQEDWTHVLDE